MWQIEISFGLAFKIALKSCGDNKRSLYNNNLKNSTLLDFYG